MQDIRKVVANKTLLTLIQKRSFVASVGQRKNSESPTGIEPVTSQIPVERSSHRATRDFWRARPFIKVNM